MPIKVHFTDLLGLIYSITRKYLLIFAAFCWSPWLSWYVLMKHGISLNVTCPCVTAVSCSPLCPWGCVGPVSPWRSCPSRWFWEAGSCRRGAAAAPRSCGIASRSGPSACRFPDGHCCETCAVEKTHYFRRVLVFITPCEAFTHISPLIHGSAFGLIIMIWWSSLMQLFCDSKIYMTWNHLKTNWG